MGKLSQIGIIIAVLGGVVSLIGLFPSVTGLEPSQGIGIVQILVILAGFAILIMGAYLFVQSSYYPRIKHNLAQQIGIRLSMTGLVVATASGLADILGFGSHPPSPTERPFLGPWQVAGLIGGFIIASIGLILFVLMGDAVHTEDDDEVL